VSLIDRETVFVELPNAESALVIVRELRAGGLVQGTDFDFKYQRTQYSDDEWEVIRPSGAEFLFREHKWATFFRIKYGAV
jgi:hypothetical protein